MSVTVKEVWGFYWAVHLQRVRAAKRFASAWKRLEPHFGNLSTSIITPQHVKIYEESRTASPATVARELSVLRSALNYAYKTGMIPGAPFIPIRALSNPRQRILTTKEQRSLVRHALDPELKLFIQIALLTGQRLNAILGLQWSRINFATRIIDFNEPDALRAERMKGRAAMPLSEALLEVLKAWGETCPDDGRTEWVFPLLHGRPTRLWTLFKRACEASGIEETSPHTIRHTVATNLVKQGVPLLQVSRLLGHKSIATTEANYLKLTPDYLKGVVNHLKL